MEQSGQTSQYAISLIMLNPEWKLSREIAMYFLSSFKKKEIIKNHKKTSVLLDHRATQ